MATPTKSSRNSFYEAANTLLTYRKEFVAKGEEDKEDNGRNFWAEPDTNGDKIVQYARIIKSKQQRILCKWYKPDRYNQGELGFYIILWAERIKGDESQWVDIKDLVQNSQHSQLHDIAAGAKYEGALVAKTSWIETGDGCQWRFEQRHQNTEDPAPKYVEP
jgi:hypothetical protein